LISFVGQDSSYQIPGASVAIFKDRQLVCVRGFGYADVDTTELVQPTSLFHIASVSKRSTAATWRLVTRSDLRGDDALSSDLAASGIQGCGNGANRPL
jgi:CubicO group peptidase (beta-lactamase class C family)